MTYDEALATRVRAAISEHAPWEERKMFGGLTFMVNTHMACGLVGGDLMVRVGAANHDEALARGAVEMEFTGRPMRGMVLVPAAGLDTQVTLDDWVERAVAFARSEPPKAPKNPKPPPTG